MVSKDEWDTKEGPGKSMRICYMHSGMAKGTSRAKVTSNSKKIKPITLAIVKLRESEGIKQLVSQSVENSVK